MRSLAPPLAGRERVAVGSDHVGLDLKVALLEACRAAGYDVIDYGTHSYDRMDYPDTAYAVVEALASGKGDIGILVCGTGAGMQIAANRDHSIRAVAVTDVYTACCARAHNDANVICLGSRVVTHTVALELLATFLATDFDGGRHNARVDKLSRPMPDTSS